MSRKSSSSGVVTFKSLPSCVVGIYSSSPSKYLLVLKDEAGQYFLRLLRTRFPTRVVYVPVRVVPNTRILEFRYYISVATVHDDRTFPLAIFDRRFLTKPKSAPFRTGICLCFPRGRNFGVQYVDTTRRHRRVASSKFRQRGTPR